MELHTQTLQLCNRTVGSCLCRHQCGCILRCPFMMSAAWVSRGLT